MKQFILLFIIILQSCHPYKKIHTPHRISNTTGSSFYETASAFTWKQRDSFVLKEIFSGNMPAFLKKFVPVTVETMDSVSGKIIKAVFYTAPDYLSVGTDNNWARINITPNAAQKIADSLDCFLPTKKMVDDIYHAAVVKLAPVPMYTLRDSTPTMYHHHLIIEGQRKGRKGLIAGIKKDVVISGNISRDPRPDRVAIYGWHQLNGIPIQPLYTGHVFWWVDYSQGIRLVYRKMKVYIGSSKGVWMDYTDILKNAQLQKLICDEQYCDFYKYPY
ncbi:MAG: hypothetical protein ACJ75F_10025 [Flavisolibacter sp.]